LPLRKEHGDLICATSEDRLVEAIGLLQSVQIFLSFKFVLAEPRVLEQLVMSRYALQTTNPG
jgi:hypothetical protein